MTQGDVPSSTSMMTMSHYLLHSLVGYRIARDDSCWLCNDHFVVEYKVEVQQEEGCPGCYLAGNNYRSILHVEEQLAPNWVRGTRSTMTSGQIFSRSNFLAWNRGILELVGVRDEQHLL